MPASSQYEKYQEQSVNTLTPGELIILLYDKAVLNMSAAIRDIDKKNPREAHRHIRKAQDIIFYLRGILDPSLPVSGVLKNYYNVVVGQLSRANVKKDAAALEDAVGAMKELRDMWQTIETQARKNTAHERKLP